MNAVTYALALLAAPALSQATTAAIDPADQLIDLMLPADRMLAGARESARASFAQIGTDPNIAKLEKAKPGLVAALRRTLDAEVDRAIPTLGANMRRAYRTLFTTRLTAAELVEVRDFYTSPVGARMLAQAHAAGQEKAQSLAGQGGDRLTASTVQAIANEATAASLQTVRPEDVPALTRFAQTSGAQKMLTLQQEGNRIAAAEANAMIASLGPKLGEAMKATLDRHMRGGR